MTQANIFLRPQRRFNFSAKLLALGLIAGAAVTAPLDRAWADYPDHTITAIVPFGPGGSNDIVGRLLSTYMAKSLGQPVIVVNKPGAGGNIGMQSLAQSKPDGYTICFVSSAATQNPALYRKMPYDPVNDMLPVAQTAEGPLIIAVKKDLPAKTLQEFIDLMKKNPGKLNASSAGTSTQLAIELFNLQNNVTATIATYDGSGGAANSLLAGETDYAIIDALPLMGGLSSGGVRALAVAGEKRLASLPNVPTTKEAGSPNFLSSSPFGVYAPKGTPPEIVNKLNATLAEILKIPDVVERFSTLGITPVAKTPAEFKAFYLSEVETWKKVVVAAKIPMFDD